MRSNTLNSALSEKYDKLSSNIRNLERVIVAFSGGIDSSLVAYVAANELHENALIVTSGSKSLKRSDLSLTHDLAGSWDLNHRVITTDELSNSNYRANPTNRCFYCKTSLYSALEKIAVSENYEYVLNGTNVDDLGDHRPGLIAAKDYNVISPLVDAQFNKQDIRDLAEHLGLENAQKPQAACLSSRFPYGSHITEKRLKQVEAAEDVLSDIGFTQFRVRHHEEVARIELMHVEMPLAYEHSNEIDTRIKECGYRFVTIDLSGFRSGSLNEGIIKVVNVYEPES